MLCIYVCVYVNVYRYIYNICFKISVGLAISTSKGRVECIVRILSWRTVPVYSDSRCYDEWNKTLMLWGEEITCEPMQPLPHTETLSAFTRFLWAWFTVSCRNKSRSRSTRPFELRCFLKWGVWVGVGVRAATCLLAPLPYLLLSLSFCKKLTSGDLVSAYYSVMPRSKGMFT